jgi:hypothetical protein
MANRIATYGKVAAAESKRLESVQMACFFWICTGDLFFQGPTDAVCCSNCDAQLVPIDPAACASTETSAMLRLNCDSS